jgi:hypothetical protein
MKKSLYVVVPILCIGLLLVLDYSGLLWSGVILKKREQIRRKIFEETKSYNEGKEQDLLRWMQEYKLAKTYEEKEAIAFTIRHSFADYDENKLAIELRDFLKKIKY